MTSDELFDMAAKAAEANAKAQTPNHRILAGGVEYTPGSSGRRKLYEIRNDFYEVGDLLEEIADGNDAEISDQMQDRLDALSGELSDKLHSCGLYLRDQEAHINALKAEIDRMTKLRRTAERKCEWFRNYMQTAMEAADMTKVNGDLCTVSLRKCAPSVMVQDLDALVEADTTGEFVRTPPTPEPQPDKKLILKHWKETGKILPGCIVNDSKRTLQVK